MIEKYIENGSQNLELVDCFSIDRDGEAFTFNPKKIGSKQLLWHGSRFSNYVGIITQGLRIAPPEAPRTGYWQGKGVYFANQIALSFRYGCPSLSEGVGIYILGEVALGSPFLTTNGNSHLNEANLLAQGHNSTHATGDMPDPLDYTTVFNDVVVPFGKNTNRSYNMFIVYNTNQVRMRYIVRIKEKH